MSTPVHGPVDTGWRRVRRVILDRDLLVLVVIGVLCWSRSSWWRWAPIDHLVIGPVGSHVEPDTIAALWALLGGLVGACATVGLVWPERRDAVWRATMQVATVAAVVLLVGLVLTLWSAGHPEAHRHAWSNVVIAALLWLNLTQVPGRDARRLATAVKR